MLKIGITGGIGSGKSTVCKVFETLGIPVFYADHAAKWLMENDNNLMASIRELFGEKAYINGKLNREHIASKAFGHPEKLQQLNALTHPATIRYGNDWMENQTGPYAIKEAALFFESGSYSDLDLIIGVYAPLEVRINRSMQRDGVTREKVLERIAQQMDEEEKMKRCDIVITNDDIAAVIPQVLKVHEQFLSKDELPVI
jgi:dephospho-CoA kinase